MNQTDQNLARRCRPAALPCLALALALGCGGGGTKTTITSFSPAAGPVNTLVTVNGSGFADGIFYGTLGGEPIPPSYGSLISDSQVAFTVPATAVTGVISLQTDGGTAVSANRFIVAPSITYFTDTAGPVGTVVYGEGGGLAGITQITFGTTVCVPTRQSSVSIGFAVPLDAPLGPTTITYHVDPSYGLPDLQETFTVTN